MDGVQRNFNMMAEKIDRMRCLRERCDSYVRLIKLTLDETIREQNTLLDGSAIHNRLKRIGVKNKRPTTLLNDYAFNIDNNNIIYDKNTDFYYNYKYSMFDNCTLGIGPHKKNINVNSTIPPYLQPINNNSAYYNSGCKPKKLYDFSSDATVYADDHCENSYYLPISSKNYETSTNVRTAYPREYQVCYFPTSKPIPQYPRQTTERFYKRNPVKQYPVEQVPYWHTRYIKPVKVVEREPYYRTVDYDYYSGTNQDYLVGDKNFEPYTQHRNTYRPRYRPANDCSTYRGLDESSYYYVPDVQGQRSFSSVTRPCSPVYSSSGNDISYSKTRFENAAGSLLEKQIRDYVWNPRKDLQRVDKYTIPNYEKSTHYCTSFKPSSVQNNYHQSNDTNGTRLPVELDSPQIQNQTIEVSKADSSYYKKPSTLLHMSPERSRRSHEECFQPRKDAGDHIDHIPENTSYNTKTETPVNFPKRISFDLGNANTELPNRKKSISEKNTVQYANTVERKSSLGRRESNPSKLDNMRRTSLMLNDDYPVSISKPRSILPSQTNGGSRKEFLSRPDKLDAVVNPRESNKNLNFPKNPKENNLNALEKNVVNYNSGTNDDIVRHDYVQNNDTEYCPKRQNDKNNDARKHLSSEKVRNDNGVISRDNEKRKLTESTGKSNFSNEDRSKNKSKEKDKIKILERRESYKDGRQFKKEGNSAGKNNSIDTADSQLDKKYNDSQNIVINDPSKSISPFAVDRNNDDTNSSRTGGEKITDRVQQVINNDDIVENGIDPEAILPYREVDDSNVETADGIINSAEQDSFDYESNANKMQEPSREIIVANNDEYGNNIMNNYYQDRPSNDDINAVHSSMHESVPEVQPEYVDGRDNENYDYPTDEFADSKKENNIITSGEHHVAEPVQHDEFVDGNLHGELYYQNRTAAGDTKENPTGNQYDETPTAADPQEKYTAEPLHGNGDDYYYQNNYSNVEVLGERPENQYPAEPDHRQGEYNGAATTAAAVMSDAEYDNNNFYNNNNNYQDRAGVDVAEQRQADDGQYELADPNYQENHVDPQQRQPDDEYYYQNDNSNNYPNGGVKEQQENQYAEPVGEYVQGGRTELQRDDGYYYGNDPGNEGNADERSIDRHYVEPEQRESYVGEARDDNNYYYENNNSDDVNAADSRLSAQYDEHHHGQQESYTDNRHADGGYYYQKPDDDGVYDESIPNEQAYGGDYDVGDDQHRTNADTSYYPDSQAHDNINNYDPQTADYENNGYQQPAGYIGPSSYERNPNENYNDYTGIDDAIIDGSRPENLISDDPQQNTNNNQEL
ncbi:Hypothetical protein CINCED_3A009034 [Cinara cedri]|uniref:GATA zinc finger domain-containing protein 14-like n=1 Tax=Cinara cedri TaxID=506608 RepID=A0A5E4NLR9_9HEMI|nr:Hypothetical protein CINCED_3A009034 [Cinara cedri]